MSAADTNERIVRRFLDRVVAALSPEIAAELVSADAVVHDRLPGQPPGREGIVWLSELVSRAFGYLDVEVQDLVVAGDRVVARWTAKPGQKRGRGSRDLTITGIDMFRLVDGAIVEYGSQSNLGAVLEQREPRRDAAPLDVGSTVAAEIPADEAVAADDGQTAELYAALSTPAAPADAAPAPRNTLRRGKARYDAPAADADASPDASLSPIDQDRKAFRDNPDLAKGLTLNQEYRYCFIKSLVDPNLVRPVIYTPRNAVEDDRVFAMAEADIILGEVQEMTAITDALQNSDPSRGAGLMAAGVAITGDRYRWPNGRVPYAIDPALPSPTRVANAINHWQQRTGGLIQFVQRTNETDYVTFRRGGGCASSVGRMGGQQFVELALTCTTGNVIHEIGHTLGLWHEQSREDRDRFVKIMWANIQPDMMHNFFQHITDGDDIGPYDYASIMHYNATAFSSNGAATIVTPHGESIGQRIGLSDGDVAAVRALYAGRAASPASSGSSWWESLDRALPQLVEALRGVMDESEVRAAVTGGLTAGTPAGTPARASSKVVEAAVR
ncbi:MAG: ester cyclase [Chloroflexi bacterium]|nr:ester cyclase [Chloroflexota bacterium]